jgi:hypothetical protein
MQAVKVLHVVQCVKCNPAGMRRSRQDYKTDHSRTHHLGGNLPLGTTLPDTSSAC